MDIESCKLTRSKNSARKRRKAVRAFFGILHFCALSFLSRAAVALILACFDAASFLAHKSICLRLAPFGGGHFCLANCLASLGVGFTMTFTANGLYVFISLSYRFLSRWAALTKRDLAFFDKACHCLETSLDLSLMLSPSNLICPSRLADCP